MPPVASIARPPTSGVSAPPASASPARRLAAPRAPRRLGHARPPPSRARARVPGAFTNPFAPPDLSGELLGAVATFALESYLASYASIDADVDADVLGLLRGRVDGVVIRGRGWRSRKNLTCRSLRFAVGEAAVDQTALIAERLVKLRGVARGEASLEFDASDFANFLAHPLTAAEATRNGPGGFPFAFDPRGIEPDGLGVAVDGGKEKGTTGLYFTDDGAVAFSGRWEAGEGDERSGRYEMELRPAGAEGKVAVRASRSDGRDATAMATAMEAFFETLTIDLRGARLSYRDMRVRDGIAVLKLRLRVVSFPPPASFAEI